MLASTSEAGLWRIANTMKKNAPISKMTRLNQRIQRIINDELSLLSKVTLLIVFTSPSITS